MVGAGRKAAFDDGLARGGQPGGADRSGERALSSITGDRRNRIAADLSRRPANVDQLGIGGRSIVKQRRLRASSVDPVTCRPGYRLPIEMDMAVGRFGR